MDEYYNKGHGQDPSTSKKSTPTVNSTKKIQDLFANYKDASTNKMEAEGIEKFFNDLGVDPMDLVTLLISKYM